MGEKTGAVCKLLKIRGGKCGRREPKGIRWPAGMAANDHVLCYYESTYLARTNLQVIEDLADSSWGDSGSYMSDAAFFNLVVRSLLGKRLALEGEFSSEVGAENLAQCFDLRVAGEAARGRVEEVTSARLRVIHREGFRLRGRLRV